MTNGGGDRDGYSYYWTVGQCHKANHTVPWSMVAPAESNVSNRRRNWLRAADFEASSSESFLLVVVVIVELMLS
jgi:hypothetical protein